MNLSIDTLVGGRAGESPLTARGRTQAHLLGEHLQRQGIRFDAVYTSPAVRAKGTAELVLQAMGSTGSSMDVQVRGGLNEMTQGDWEGKPRSECYTSEVHAQIDADPVGFAAPHGESKLDVQARTVAVMTEIATAWQDRFGSDTDAAGCVAVIGHGVSFKLFVRHALQSDWANCHTLGLDNTGMIRFLFSPDGSWQLQSLNDTAHLQQAGAPKL